MPSREVNRAAWAALIKRLIADEARGNKARFARIIGKSERSISNWLHQSVAVSEDSVRQVADALSRDKLDLLVEVGYYDPDEIAKELADSRHFIDRIRQLLDNDPGLLPYQRQEILKEVEELLHAYEEQLLKLAERLAQREKKKTRRDKGA